MGGYDANDTKGNIGKIIGSMLGVPPVLLNDEDDDDKIESDEGAPTAESEKSAERDA